MQKAFRPWAGKAAAAAAAALLLNASSAAVLAADLTDPVDSLWGESASPDVENWAYPITIWWRDRQLAGIQDAEERVKGNLAAANASLTDAWSYLLDMQRPRQLGPVPIIDEAFGAVYQSITGRRVYPLAGLLNATNHLLLKLESRDSPAAIVDKILDEVDARQLEAIRGLVDSSSPLAAVVRANLGRQQTALDKMAKLTLALPARDAVLLTERIEREQEASRRQDAAVTERSGNQHKASPPPGHAGSKPREGHPKGRP